MQQESDTRGKSSSQILPLVIAAFTGATFAVACDRPAEERMASAPRAQLAQQAPARPAVDAAASKTPAPVARPLPPPVEAISDPLITGKIESAIREDPSMAGADVSVTTDRGVVSLLGSVKSHEQTGIASAHAQKQDGVMRVDNHLALNAR